VDAQIFCLESQKRIAQDIEILLKRHVFDRMDVERLEISDDYSRSPGENDQTHCRRFLKLFKASMVRVDDFAIVVADGRGRWYYMGGCYNDEPYLLELFEDSMTSVFPAVAVMNRMVMMPHDVGDAFEKSRIFPWFVKPRDLGGVVLTDFRHPESVVEGIREVALQLKADVVRLCRRHMLARKIKTPDFLELALLLGINSRYLQLYEADIAAPRAELSSRIVSGPVRKGTSSSVVLEVQCGSEAPLGPVLVKVNAPSGTLKSPVAAMLDFTGGKQARQIEFKVIPKAQPYCPIEVLFTLDESVAPAAPFPLPLVLDVL
jgi:hypothetical protein